MTIGLLVESRSHRLYDKSKLFAKACTDARIYTIPVIIARRQIDGECSAALGAAVVINKEGWFVTAAHIGIELSKLSEQVRLFRDRPGLEAEVRADNSLSRTAQQKKLRELGRPKPKDAQNYSILWGATRTTVDSVQALNFVDIAFGKLENFDPTPFTVFPKFRKDLTETDVGTMVCRYGYPFHHIETSWDQNVEKFTFPNGIFPVPMFANEGIITRFAEIVVENENNPPSFVRRLLETSSPGLKGQSGGPIFDTKGRICAIQCDTVSYELGFAPVSKGRKEHQFLNVGRGVDASTVCSFLDQHSVSYQT